MAVILDEFGFPVKNGGASGGVQDLIRNGESFVVDGVGDFSDYIKKDSTVDGYSLAITVAGVKSNILKTVVHDQTVSNGWNLFIGESTAYPRNLHIYSFQVHLHSYASITYNGHATNTAGGFCISDASTGNLPVPGAVTEKVTPIPDTADSVTLGLGYSEHEPDAAVVYTLPTAVDGRTNTVTLHIKFTNTTSYAFSGVTETLPTVALGDEWTFVCNYELGAWHIYARKIGNQTVGNLVGIDLAGTPATVDANGVAYMRKAGYVYGLIKKSADIDIPGNDGTLSAHTASFMEYKGKGNRYVIGKYVHENRHAALVATLTVENLAVWHDIIYTHTLEDGDVISFGTPTADTAPTFELWLTQPETPVAVAFAASTVVWWADANGNFAAANPAPETLTAGVTYAYVFRWNGKRWLGNVAYEEAPEEEVTE